MALATAGSVSADRTAPPQNIRIIFLGLMLATVLASLDQTVVSTALPTIVGDLGGVRSLSWVVTAYLLTSTVTTPIWGKLGDLYGRKTLLLASIGIFLAGSVLCGVSADIGELIAFRALQGVGSGGLMTLAQTALADVVPAGQRGRYQGYFGAVFGVTSVAGPLIGGFITDHLSWRWVFYVNVPIGIIAFVICAVALTVTKVKTRPTIDYLGFALLASCATCVVLLITWGGAQYAWDSPTIIGLAVVAVVTLAAFIGVERRAAEPVIPLSLFTDRTFTVSAIVSFLVGFAMFGVITYLPQYLQIVKGTSATSSGLQLLPMMAGLLTASTLSGRVVDRTGRYREFPAAGTALVAVALLLMSRLGTGTSALTLGAYQVVLGVGLGLVSQVLVLAVQNTAPTSALGSATSTITFARSIGGSIGVAVFSALFNSGLSHQLRGLSISGVNLTSLSGSPKAVDRLPAAAHYSYTHAWVASLHTVFLVAMCFGIVGFLASLALPRGELRATTREEGQARAGGLTAVAAQFGLNATGVAAVSEEVRARLTAAGAARRRIDELASSGQIDDAAAKRLRALYDSRVADLTQDEQRVKRRIDDPDRASSATWQAGLEVLRIERSALTAPGDDTGGTPYEAAQRERDRRVSALRAALSALAQRKELPADELAYLRGLLTYRLDELTGVSPADLGVAAGEDPRDPASAGLWSALSSVLATERAALEGLGTGEVSASISERAIRDTAADHAALAGV